MTEFRGRGDEIHIAPLSFSEFYPACGKEKYDALQEYVYYGGLPRILSEVDQEDKIRYLNHLYQEIYLKDICEHYHLKNSEGIQEVMQFTASSIGSFTNPKKLSATFHSQGIKEISQPTISNYLSYLKESFLLEQAQRYDVKGKHYIGSPSKYYYSDMGLRNAVLNFRQYEETHIMENVIYNELIYRGFNVDVGIVESSYKAADGKYKKKNYEVDFVANLGSRKYYIQSAYEMGTLEKQNQKQVSLIRIPDSFKKTLLSMEIRPYGIRKKV